MTDKSKIPPRKIHKSKLGAASEEGATKTVELRFRSAS